MYLSYIIRQDRRAWGLFTCRKCQSSVLSIETNKPSSCSPPDSVNTEAKKHISFDEVLLSSEGLYGPFARFCRAICQMHMSIFVRACTENLSTTIVPWVTSTPAYFTRNLNLFICLLWYISSEGTIISSMQGVLHCLVFFTKPFNTLLAFSQISKVPILTLSLTW